MAVFEVSDILRNSMRADLILLALVFWVVICWVQFKYTDRRRKAEAEMRRWEKTRWS